MMEPRTLAYVEEGCNGQLVAGERSARVRRICTDSRLANAGDLFVAIRGEQFDGHDYINDALDQGAEAAVVSRGRLGQAEVGGPRIEVEETRNALGRLAARYRQDFELQMIAVGGSNGKTSTKEILATVLRQRFKTLSSEASFNNDIGVPLTLLRLSEDHEAAVLEVGSNHPGELQPLLEFVRPRYGLLTSIGREHLEFFGDLDGVIEEEGALAESLPPEGCLFVNGDIKGLNVIRARCHAAVVTVGEEKACDWRIGDIRAEEGGSIFEVISPKGDWSGTYRVNLLGHQNARNAALAIALAAELGLSREELDQGLLCCRPASMRMEMQTLGGVRIINDAYNSNPDSLLAALKTMELFPVKGKRIAVLGDMAELGQASESAHTEAGQHAARLGLNGLVTVGRWADTTARGAQAAGLANVAAFEDITSAGQALAKKLNSDDVLLIKGSRAAGMERIIEVLSGAMNT
ncbi:MAG TPA: UDP-N-acetylmuramoyl-tripeptide--D-alanyl-D-alanine ligase [Verrucomicrobiota bacterium]|jgi:UDP-N-acetylmuramoyl-tripeptide--D-alanyl-D-alanine ligase|nr:UDP-N-acetylmuramoyl-tripeptide--D-alanyl-D-alanine ligase [Verrucomicrobiota bacterium]